MPSLEELFKTKTLANGKTAQQTYAVQNSKDIEMSTGGLESGPFKLWNTNRRKNGVLGTETLIEEETTGLRILGDLSAPVLYGKDIAKFTLQSTKIVDTMKEATNGGGSNGLLGGFIKSATNLIDTIGAKLGVPQTIIPTKLVLNSDFSKGGGGETLANSVLETPSTLAKIKKDAAGSIFGKILQAGIKGKPEDFGKNLLGAAADAGKSALKNLLLGSRKEGIANGDISGLTYVTNRKYSKIGFRTGNDNAMKFNDLLFVRDFQTSNISTYSDKIDQLNENEAGRHDLSSMLISIDTFTDDRFPERSIIQKRKQKKYSQDGDARYNKKLFNVVELGHSTNPSVENWTDEPHRGGYTSVINKTVSYKSENGESKKTGTETTLDDFDYIPLRFFSIANKVAANFVGTITGLIETISPTWDSQKMIGNPFNFYTYTSHERTAQFNFKIYSLSPIELKANWERLQFLTGLTYPQQYTASGAVIPPFLKVTIGNMYKNKECFIESLIYTVDDNYNWEIGIDAYTKNYKLPKIIDVAVTLKFVEQKGNTLGLRKYGFGETPLGVENEFEKNNNLSPSGLYKEPKADPGGKSDGKTAGNTGTDGKKANTGAANVEVLKVPPTKPMIAQTVIPTTQQNFNYSPATVTTTNYSGYYDPKNPDADPQAKAAHDRIQRALQKAGQTPPTFDNTVYKIPTQ